MGHVVTYIKSLLLGDGSISDNGKVDIFLKKKKKKCDQPAKKKLLSKSKVADRKELVEHLRLVAKLETEVNKVMEMCFLQIFNADATKWTMKKLGSR